jgi:hypothetical protein
MGTNSWWIKTDYWVQTVLGGTILLLAASALLGSLSVFLGWKDGFMWVYGSLCLAFLFLIPLGIWQIISGFVSAVKGDYLQQIYLFVVILYFIFWGIGLNALSPIPMIVCMFIALIIGVWKYTVTRADYICLSIIDVPNIDADDLLDA